MFFHRQAQTSPSCFSTSLARCKRYIKRRRGKQDYTGVDASTQTDFDGKEGPNKLQGDVNPPKPPKDYSWMLENANDLIVLRLTPDYVQQSTIPVSSRDGYDTLCSYSWKQTDVPTIYVPGTPATFTKPDTFPLQLDPDTGLHYIDQHTHRVPKHQYEPVFQALAVVNPDVRFNNVDIVVNRSSLQNLLKFVNDKAFQAFHLDLDIEGSTLFIGRKVYKGRVSSAPGSYGRNFEATFTTEDPELEDASGHHRVLRYKLGPLDIVLRLEVDAYRADFEDDPDAPKSCLAEYIPKPELTTTIDHHSPQPTAVIARGTMVSHSKTIELKSNEKSRPLEQMWLGRTPSCCLGAHKNGFYKRTFEKHVTQKEFEEWEQKQQDGLQKLVWLLQKLREVVTNHTRERSAVLVALGKGEPLQVYETKERIGALPKEIVEHFWT